MFVTTRPKAWSLLTVATLGVATLAACGGDDDDADSPATSAADSPGTSAAGSPATSAAGSPATSADSGAETSAPGDSASEGSAGGGDEVATAEEAITPFLDVPTEINQSEPLSGPPPTDKTWVIITCELPQCQLISDGALAAGEAAGVPTELLSYKTTDGTTLTSAVKQALEFDPIAVSPIGFSQALWNDLQDEYEAAGVFITPIAVGDLETSEVVTEGSASQFDYGRSGSLMANFVIADSGASAKVLVQDVPAFAVLKAWGDGFKSTLEAGCSACEMKTLDVAPAQLASNGLVPAIVSALQADPDIEYLAATDGAFLVGIEPALKAAGLEDVKIVAGSPDINNLEAVKNGTQLAMTAAAEDQYGWVALDIVFRHALGMDIPEGDGGRSEMIAIQDNVVPAPTGLDAPADYREQYLALWGLG